MSSVHDHLQGFLVAHGLDLLIGTTILLAAFSVLLLCTRSVAVKHRVAGTAIVSATLFVVFALAPLPRVTLGNDAATARSGFLSPTPTRAAAILAPDTAPVTSFVPIEAPLPYAMVPSERPDARAGDDSPLRDDATSSILSWVTSLLLAGGFFFVAQLIVGWLRLRFVLARSVAARPEIAGLVELPRRARLRITSARTQPFCCGLLRGTIVLPAQMATNRAETRFVLLHEIAHVEAGDGRLRAVAALLRPLLFWHPLFWWLQQQLRFTGELLADAAAARGAVPEYVRSMMKLLTESTSSPSGPLVATVFRKKSELCRRLEMMLQRTRSLSPALTRRQRLLPSVAAVALVSLSAGLFGVERAVAQDPGTRQELRAEVETLRATIRDLRAELAVLRGRLRASDPLPLDRTLSIDRSTRGASPPRPSQNTAGQPAPSSLYRVRDGDSLASIAAQVFGSSKHVDRLMRLNPGVAADKLHTGQLLRIKAPPPVAADEADAPAPPPPAINSRSRARPSMPRGVQDDGASALATLISQAIELRGKVEIQEIELKYVSIEAEAGISRQKAVAIAKVRLDTTKRQLQAIRSVLEGELRSAKLALEYSQKLAKKGFVSASEVQASKNRVDWIRHGLR